MVSKVDQEKTFCNKVVTVREGTNIAVSVSPNHKNLVMDLQGVLWTLPLKGGIAKRITDNVDDASRPDWSPDGKQIAYQSYKSGNFHVWVINPEGSDKCQLTSGKYDDREPQFSPDGSQVAFSSDRSGSYDIWILDLNSGKLSQLTDTSNEEYQPTWSPNGNEIAYVSGNNGSKVKAVDETGEIRTLVQEKDGGIVTPSWSPDGENISYVLQQTNKSELMISGRKVAKEDDDVFPFPVEWLSPNKIIYTANGHIKIRDLSKGNAENVSFSANLPITKDNYQYKKHDFDSEDPKSVKGIVSPKLSPNGKQVVFIALNNLWILDIGSDMPIRLTNDSYLKADPAWSPDGNCIAYSSDKAGEEDIYILNVKNGKETKITHGSGAKIASSWSPDGTSIAFQDQNGATYIVDVEIKDVKKVHEGMWEPGHPTWGPDGKFLAMAAVKQFSNRFREGTNQILVMNIDDGSEKYVETKRFKSLSNRINSGPIWSPNGKYMAFVMESTLWVMQVDPKGNPIGEPHQVTDNIAESPSWCGDSDKLLYLSNGELYFVYKNEGKPEKVPLKLTWKPKQVKGKTIIYAGRMWDGISSEVKKNVDILVEGNRIKDIKPHDNNHFNGEKYIDAGDQTVIPGLWDAHVHQGLYSTFLGSRQGRQLLSFGITSTVSMGDPAYLSIEDKESVRSDNRVGPRLFANGEPIDGSRVYYNFMRPTTSKRQLYNKELARAKALNYDSLKSYVRLPNNFHKIEIEEAHKMGIPNFSHYFYAPMSFGQDATSHISATQRQSFSKTQSESHYAYDDVYQLMSQSGMSMTTTLFDSSTLLEFNPELLNDPRIKTLYTPWQYQELQKQYKNATTTDQSKKRVGLFRDVYQLKKIARSGGMILGGTDMPLDNVAVSLILNLQAMDRYGMTPYEVLQTITSFPAQKMGVEDELGTITIGKLADFVFIKGNPLQDIKDLYNVKNVMKNGRFHTVDELIEPYKNLTDVSPIHEQSISVMRKFEI